MLAAYEPPTFFREALDPTRSCSTFCELLGYVVDPGRIRDTSGSHPGSFPGKHGSPAEGRRRVESGEEERRAPSRRGLGRGEAFERIGFFGWGVSCVGSFLGGTAVGWPFPAGSSPWLEARPGVGNKPDFLEDEGSGGLPFHPWYRVRSLGPGGALPDRRRWCEKWWFRRPGWGGFGSR